jgi:hypothetical protein
MSSASSTVVATFAFATGSPMRSMTFLNRSRSSASSIAVRGVPSSLTPYFCSTPASASSETRLRAVWPPMPASTPSGRSFSMMAVSEDTVRGST